MFLRQVFVANPNKTQPILDILLKNQTKLIEFLSKFQNDRTEDEQFNDEKTYLVKQIRDLKRPTPQEAWGERSKRGGGGGGEEPSVCLMDPSAAAFSGFCQKSWKNNPKSFRVNWAAPQLLSKTFD